MWERKEVCIAEGDSCGRGRKCVSLKVIHVGEEGSVYR